MTTLIYCPTCWPADLGERDERQRCRECGTVVMHATPEKSVELLKEQNEVLTVALHQAMEYIGSRQRKRMGPTLRLVHSRKGKSE